MLFQMIQGRPPFDADSLMDVLLGHLAEPLPDLTSPHGPVPDAVTQVVRKATAKTVEMRYQSAGEIEQDLQKAASALLLESGS
jgi:serine/threonine-protein kinase